MEAEAFEMVRRAPSARMADFISGMSGYREMFLGRSCQREPASMTVPLIISLGTPFLIAHNRDPGATDRQPSFVGGLYVGPVHMESNGSAETVQVDFTPLGAYRFFGGAVVDLIARMVDIADVLGPAGVRLRERLGATSCWQHRFDMLEDFIVDRAVYQPSPEIKFAYSRLSLSSGDARIASLAQDIGWSRKHLLARFRAEIGLGPKSVGRIMRFRHACRLARAGAAGGWAMIAAESSYSDQAHLTREFTALAGEPPTAWARRINLLDPRLTPPSEALC